MKLMFLGGFFEKEMEEEIINDSKGTVQYAANKFQWNLIDGFQRQSDIELSLLSAPFIGAFPKYYKKTYFKNEDDIYVNFNNIWGYKNIARKRGLQKQIVDFAKQESNKKVIIVYSPHTPFLQAAVYAKKIDPSIHICLVVPDLPEFMNLNDKKTIVYQIFKKIDIKVLYKNLKYVSTFVLLTDQMREMLPINQSPYTVVEGLVKHQKNITLNESKKSLDSQKSILYTGTLNKKFGVINLVKAFIEMNREDVILNICGSGDSEEEIKKYSKKYLNLKFWGQVSNDKALDLQSNATILVNPRQNNELFTRYSFPSKNMEYLLSGKPLVAYKLDGIPNEYDSYIQYVEDNEISTLSKKLESILNLSVNEQIEIGQKGRNFVLNEKNNIIAAKKIIEMIRNTR